MTRQQAKEFLTASSNVHSSMLSDHFYKLLPILKAFANGHTIEWRACESNEWEKMGDDMGVSWDSKCYRIGLPTHTTIQIENEAYTLNIQQALKLGALVKR